MSVGMLYLSCVKIRELRSFVEKLSKILHKSCQCILLQFYLMYTGIILYLESIPSGHLKLEQRLNVVEITSLRRSELQFNVDPTYSACRVVAIIA